MRIGPIDDVRSSRPNRFSVLSLLGTGPVVILLRQNVISGGRANLNTLTVTQDLTTTGNKLANAVDLTGLNTGIGYVQVTGFNQVNAAGQSAWTVPGHFNVGELNQSWYVDTATANVNITGLSPGVAYQITFAATRDVPSTDTQRTGEMSILAGTVSDGVNVKILNAAAPSSGTTAGNVVFVVTPTSSGIVSFSYKRATGNTTGFAYLGGIHIQRA